jgi:hypothetical protein
LFRVGSGTIAAGWRQGNVELTVVAARAAFAATDGVGFAGVENFVENSHESFLGVC